MTKMKARKSRTSPKIDTQIASLVALEKELRKLPPMSDLQKAKLEHGLAIDHLYYSSKIEGSNLTKRQIDQAIHGQGSSLA